MEELTKEQEDQIHDLPHHEKKSCINGTIPIDPDRFDQIVKGIGRRKLGKTIIKVKGGL